MQEDFDLSKTDWEIDPERPNFLRKRKGKEVTERKTERGTVTGVGGTVQWKAFKGKTDAEKQKNAVEFAEIIDTIM